MFVSVDVPLTGPGCTAHEKCVQVESLSAELEHYNTAVKAS